MWPNIFHALSGKSTEEEIMDIFHAPSGKTINIIETIGSEQPIRLPWTHYRVILQVEDTEARSWYEHEAATEMWSTRTLQRNVSSQYYKRLLKSQTNLPFMMRWWP